MKWIASASALLLGLFAAGCNGEVVVGGQNVPARLVLVSGDLQSGTVGKELPAPLVVRVLDEKDRPVRNQLVNFVVTAGGGSVFAGAALTDRNGEARERWTLGTVAGDTQRVEARAVNTETGAPQVFGVFRAVGVADVFASLAAVGPVSLSGTAQEPVADSLAVRAVDRYGNPVAGVEVRWSATQGGGSFSPAASTTGAAGIARSQWILGPATGFQTARAVAGSAGPVDFTAATAAAIPVRLELSPRTLSFTSLRQTLPVSVIARDRTGAAIPGLQVTVYSANLGVAIVDAEPAVMSTGNGTTRIIAALGDLRDTITVTVQQVAVSIAIDRDSLALQVGSTARITAGARDANAIPVAGFPVSFTSSAPGVATVDAAGTVRGVAPGNAVITAASGSLSASLPVRVYAVTGTLQVSRIAVGEAHSCAVDARGRTLCWGRVVGRNSRVPVVIGGPALASLHGGGRDFICGLTSQGAAYCWGDNSFGQLGNGSASNASAPVAVSGGHAFTSLAVGSVFACGLTSSGAAYCWGEGSGGTLGNGQSSNSSVPVPVAGGVTFARISAGDHHVCGVSTAGVAYCWGANRDGEGGYAPTGCQGYFYEGVEGGCVNVPTRVAGSVVFRSLAPGYDHTCGLADDGTAYCWGNGSGGKLGNGQSNTTFTPAPVSGGQRFSWLVSGRYTTCGRTTGGQPMCWGHNTWGQYGNGTTVSASVPTVMARGRDFTRLAMSQWHGCGIDTSGIAYCWGQGSDGQLGQSVQSNPLYPGPVAAPD